MKHALFLSALNIVWVATAHLYTWRPVTFKYMLKPLRAYTFVPDNIVFAVIAFTVALRTRRMIQSVDELWDIVYGNDATKWTVISYRFNWLAFIFWQIIIVVLWMWLL